MKIIIAGASGFLATEVVRQSLRMKQIISVIALARKPITAPEDAGADASKLKSVVIQDYEHYPDDVKKEFAGADACIWTVAITPSKSRSYDFDTVRRVCQTSTIAGLRAIWSAGPANPFRFVYMSGEGVQRDQSKKPWIMGRYLLMRGETESQVLEFAAEHKGELEVCVAKPVFITGSEGVMGLVGGKGLRLPGLPITIPASEVAAAILDQVVRGFEKETYSSDDLARLGRAALTALDG